jgi:DNA-binding NarL/FixJ family response regulator
MKKIRIAVVDDHKLIREMWSILFAANTSVELVGESGEFDDALEMIKTQRPDIVLLDINLWESSGFDAIPLIRKFCPATRIIVVSMHNKPAYAKKVLKLGAKGYLTKNSSPGEIFKAIEEVMKGDLYICTEIKDFLFEQTLNEEPAPVDIKSLSLREIEVVKLLIEGCSSKQIGLNLYISPRTVEAHRYNILKKLKLKNTASLIKFINSKNISF